MQEHQQGAGSGETGLQYGFRRPVVERRPWARPSLPPSGLTPAALLQAQRLAGNGAVTGLLRQRSAVVIQRDWTGDRTAEIQGVMNGVDWNRPGGPWFLLNGHNPEGLVGILQRLGKKGRAELTAHPVDGGKYDKSRLDLGMRLAAAGGSAAQVNAMDAIRNAVAAGTWADCWVVLLKLSGATRKSLYGSIGRADLRKLLENVNFADETRQAALEAEINDVIAPPVKDILLDFVPDAGELPDAAGNPEPLGEITVLLKGVPVMKVSARGGPWKSFKDKNNPGHTADPTEAGTFTLAAGAPVVTSAWNFSQIANGTPIRDTGTQVEVFRGGKWVSTSALAKPIDRDSIMKLSARVTLIRRINRNDITLADGQKEFARMKASDDFSPLSPTWVLNDFGKEGFRIVGTPGDIIHTTPETDDEAASALVPGNLSFSHGCVHILGPDRQKLIEEGFLRGGVKIKIHAYDTAKMSRWGDPKQ